MIWALLLLQLSYAGTTFSVANGPSANPAIIEAHVTAHHVSLEWNSSTTPGVKYYVYRRRKAVATFAKLNTTPLAVETYTDTTVTAGHTYIYEITAEIGGVESAPSNEVSVAIK
jgi:fibronectin type 3 domain-containing protein